LPEKADTPHDSMERREENKCTWCYQKHDDQRCSNPHFRCTRQRGCEVPTTHVFYATLYRCLASGVRRRGQSNVPRMRGLPKHPQCMRDESATPTPSISHDTPSTTPERYDTNPVARTEEPPHPLSLDGYPMTHTNVTKVMCSLHISRQRAEEQFHNIRFTHMQWMHRSPERPEEPPGRAYSPDHQYDDDYSLDVE